ncbi:unnamed protein product [Ectocarpus sp. 8 AP-2014]
MSILLIPFSFDFVDAVCIATVLGFLCEAGDKAVVRLGTRVGGNKVAVLAADEGKPETDCEVGETTGKTVPYGLDASRKTSVSAAATVPPTRRHTTGPLYLTPTSTLRGHGDGRDVSDSNLPRSARTSSNLLQKMSFLYSSRSFPKLTLMKSGAALHPGSDLGEETVTPSAHDDDTGSVHWGLALVGVMQLLMSAVDDYISDV